MAIDISDLKGMRLELNVSLDPRRYIPRQLAVKARRMSEERFEELMGALDSDAVDDLLRADALVEAERAGMAEPVVIVVEAAWSAHVDDVERAERRATYLQRPGVSSIALVISRIDPEPRALDAAKERAVAVMSESRGLLVPERPTAA